MRKSVTIFWDDDERPLTPAWLTTQHPSSSYGLPVIVCRASDLDPTLTVFGPGDLAGKVITEDPEALARGELAGYRMGQGRP